jgi:hypothetical protein
MESSCCWLVEMTTMTNDGDDGARWPLCPVAHFTGDVRDFVLDLVKLCKEKYTDTLWTMWLVNAPLVFRAVWAVLSRVLRRSTQAGPGPGPGPGPEAQAGYQCCHLFRQRPIMLIHDPQETHPVSSLIPSERRCRTSNASKPGPRRYIRISRTAVQPGLA